MYKNKVFKKIIIVTMVFLLLISCTQKEDHKNNNKSVKQTIEDMAGRTVELPASVYKIFSLGPEGTILLYTLNPDKLAGWNYSLREGEKEFIPEKYHDLPNLGGAGKELVNVEEVLKIDPDILIMMDIIDSNSISKADEMEELMGKPLFLLDVNINKIDKAYRFLGRIIGEENKAKILADYCEDSIKDVNENFHKISKEIKKRVYYAEGPNGLQTEPGGSWHAELIEMVGGINVAEVSVKEGKGKSEVSIEQLLSWDPDLIISWDDERGGYYSEILKDPNWKSIYAVENSEVYEIPNKPFNWFDRPPSANRILGLKWLGNLLYPEVYNYDIKEEVKKFYSEFYRYNLSDEEAIVILKNSTR